MTEGGGGNSPENNEIQPKGPRPIDQLFKSGKKVAQKVDKWSIQASNRAVEKGKEVVGKLQTPEGRAELQKEFDEFVEKAVPPALMAITITSANWLEDQAKSRYENWKQRQDEKKAGRAEKRLSRKIEKSSREYRNFYTIQNELRNLVENPNKEKETQLIYERAMLVQDAKDARVFDYLQKEILSLQQHRGYEEARREILKINSYSDDYENTLRSTLPHWNDKWKGLIDEYRDGAIRNMDLALLRVIYEDSLGDNPVLKREIEIRHRRVKLLNWGEERDHASSLENAARLDLDNIDLDTYFPKTRLFSVQEQQGQLPAGISQLNESVQRLIGTLERGGEAVPQSLQRATTPEFTGDPSSLQQAIFEGFLAAYQSQNVSPEEQRKSFLEVEEYGGGQIQPPPLESIFLKDLTPAEKAQFRARVALSNARAFNQAAKLPKDLFPNSAAMEITKEQMNTLTGHKLASEAWSLYSVMVVNPDSRSLGRDWANFLGSFRYSREGNEVVGIKNLLDIEDEQDLDNFRNHFRGFLAQRFSGHTEAEIRVAEHIGFNLLKMSEVAELVDGNTTVLGFRRIRRKSAITPLVNSAGRDLLHPLDKAIEDNATKNKPWPTNVLGQYLRFNFRKLGRDKAPMPEILYQSFAVKTAVGKSGSREVTLLEKLYKDGEMLVAGRRDGVDRFDWKSLKDEYPFNGYMLYKYKAVQFFNTLVTGKLPEGVTWEGFGALMKDLNIKRDTREAMVYLLRYVEGAVDMNPRKSQFRPAGKLFYKPPFIMKGFWSGFNNSYPEFFE